MSLFLGPLQKGPRDLESVLEPLEPISLEPRRLQFFFGFGDARQRPFALANAPERDSQVARGLGQFLLKARYQTSDVGWGSHAAPTLVEADLGGHLRGFLARRVCRGLKRRDAKAAGCALERPPFLDILVQALAVLAFLFEPVL